MNTFPAVSISIPETTEVDSSQIHSRGYDPVREIAFIRFRSKDGFKRTTYAYPEFDAELWAEFVKAESAGSFFGKHIRDQWTGRFFYLPGLDTPSV